MKLEVGKKYRTVCGLVVTVKSSNKDYYYPFIVDDRGVERFYTADGFYLRTKELSDFNIIEEIKENTMFNKEYKYLCMDADGYNKAAFNRPAINTDMNCWVGYEDILQVGLFNLGDDWKESLREIMYNDDGSIYLRKPRHEFKVDDKVLVKRAGLTKWYKRHFCCYNLDSSVKCYVEGRTSFTTKVITDWDEIKPYEEEL